MCDCAEASRSIVDDIEGVCAPSRPKPKHMMSSRSEFCGAMTLQMMNGGGGHMRATEPVEVSKPIIKPCFGIGTIFVNRTRDMAWGG